METFIAMVAVFLGDQAQTRFFGGFQTEQACWKFSRWQVDAALAQDIQSVTMCVPEREFRRLHPTGVIEEPST